MKSNRNQEKYIREKFEEIRRNRATRKKSKSSSGPKREKDISENEDELVNNEEPEEYPSHFNRYGFYPRSSPRQAKGGIKAQAQRGTFVKNWWAKRWIEVLESFRIGARLDRGRSYARKGQVLSIVIDKGIVTAQVQGSRSKPYTIQIKVKELKTSEWKQLIESIAQQPIFMAKLLSGVMPDDIEYCFHDLGLSLFPSKSIDLVTQCNCPDWSNPCKHIAAVFYLLGEEFDRDPFLIFKLRGLGRDELCSRLSPIQKEISQSNPTGLPKIESEPLLKEDKAFWQGEDLSKFIMDEMNLPPIHAALLKRLGHFPFWSSSKPLIPFMEDMYSKISQYAFDLTLREWKE